MSIQPGAAAEEFRVSVDAGGRGVIGILEVIDARGRCVKTLRPEWTGGSASVVLSKRDPTMPPGTYTLRYREGLRLTLAGHLKRPGGQPWLNPTDLSLQPGGWVYVLDSGFAVEDPKEVERGWTPRSGAPFQGKLQTLDAKAGTLTVAPTGGAVTTYKFDDVSPADLDAARQIDAARQAAVRDRAAKTAALYKLRIDDGTPDPSFGQSGRLELPGLTALRSFAVDEKGAIYLGGGSHSAAVLDTHGKPTPQTIGGWDGDPVGPKATPWVNSVALAPPNRIYIPNGYGNIKAYDRTKNEFAGIQHRTDFASLPGLDRCIGVDPISNGVYTLDSAGLLQRRVDDGKSLSLRYATGPELKLARPTGLSAAAGLVCLAAHGPGLGPYWDSGGGGEIVLILDDGQNLELLARFGTPGVGQGLEFLNPSAAIVSADHSEIWVTEDGLANPEGPPGNARIRRFQLDAEQRDEIALDLTR